MKTKKLWRLACGGSLLLAICLAWQWYRVDRAYEPNRAELVDDAAVADYTQRYEQRQSSDDPPIYIPTGVFLQSLKFTSAADVEVTGYVWQHFTKGQHDDVERGFVLPEAVNTEGEGEPRVAYRRADGDQEVIGWYFEATLRQRFDYSKYPLDHKTVWMRMWPVEFDRNVILVPDLDSYDSTAFAAAFGVDPRIVLGGWEIEETFFDYKPVSYDTNFGIEDYVGQHGFPELYFNVVIHRDFFNAFITHLVPLTVVAALLFAMMLMVTNDKELASRFGFSTSGVVGASSGLFFVIMLAHVQLRNEFPSSGIVYIELFYFMMYFVILAVVTNTYLISTNRPIRWLQYGDNLIPKLIYWPTILLAMNVITLITFAL